MRLRVDMGVMPAIGLLEPDGDEVCGESASGGGDSDEGPKHRKKKSKPKPKPVVQPFTKRAPTQKCVQSSYTLRSRLKLF